MGAPPTKRTYSNLSLESWFQHLIPEWEGYFPVEALRLGRECYRDDIIREVELSNEDAIVNAKIKGEEHYAVLEWKEGALSSRASVQNPILGKALAVAGIYEIEALIADEISMLPLEDDVQPEEPLHEDWRLQFPQEPQAVARPLVLEVSVGSLGLMVRSFWQDPEKGRIPALTDKESLKGQALSLPEREKIIQFIRLAHRAGFRLLPYKKAYVLKDFSNAQYFLKKELPRWRLWFRVERDKELLLLRKGEQSLEAITQLAADDRASARLSWKLCLGDELLSELESSSVMRHVGQVTFLKGKGLVRLSAPRQKLLADWQGFADKQIPYYMLFAFSQEAGKALELSPELESWKASLLKGPQEKEKKISCLRPYQERGVKFLRHLAEHDCHGLLADEMGLGKTLQTLSLIASYPTRGKPSLIVCPASVIPVWIKEAAQFFPELKLAVLKKGNDFKALEQPDVWLSSYTQLRRHKPLLGEVEFGYAVLDEGQFIKNPEAKVTQACLSVRAAHRFVLTGTPLENRVLDVWTLFRFLMPGLLGTRKQFENRFANQDAESLEALRTQIAPFVLRRKKTDVLEELPEKVEMDLHCPLTDLQRENYQALVEKGTAAMTGTLPQVMKHQSMSVLTLLTRLRQVCCDPALLPEHQPCDFQQSGKLKVLLERLSELLEGGHKIVIFSQFVSLLDRVEGAITQEYPHCPLYKLTGQTLDRAEPVDTFQEAEGAAVILVSLRAGGTGITLHAAEYVFLLDPWWNPAVEAQAIDRVHRIGQKHPTFIYRLIAPGTVEERIQKLKTQKKDLFEGVVGELKDVSQVLSYYESLGQLIDLE